jgi:uncharacterized RDD family membrane protein YckC
MTTYPWHTAPAPVPVDERAEIRGRRAGLVTRSLANIADVVVVVLLVTAGWLGVAAFRFLVHPARFTFPAPGFAVLLLVGLGVLALYFAGSWALVGGTYGDRLLGLRVVGHHGERLHWGMAAVRAVVCTLVPIGLFWVLVSTENRSLQDLLLRTSVVYD